ncbi:hypothetical protein BJX63DRAFT_74095 [Aspergillus granulosus]|uniref:Uncharacterized protein n=1 Tax=Aspergillus granulosus TaxID=176169 RepID=A0ABR4GWZ9_9EURO
MELMRQRAYLGRLRHAFRPGPSNDFLSAEERWATFKVSNPPMRNERACTQTPSVLDLVLAILVRREPSVISQDGVDCTGFGFQTRMEQQSDRRLPNTRSRWQKNAGCPDRHDRSLKSTDIDRVQMVHGGSKLCPTRIVVLIVVRPSETREHSQSAQSLGLDSR